MHTHRKQAHTAFCITFVIFQTLCAVPPDPSYLPSFLTKTKIKFQTVGLSELLATICLCSCSFFFIFFFYLFSVKVQACLCGELVDISTCCKSHSFSEWQLLTHNRSQWLRHCSLCLSSPSLLSSPKLLISS